MVNPFSTGSFSSDKNDCATLARHLVSYPFFNGVIATLCNFLPVVVGNGRIAFDDTHLPNLGCPPVIWLVVEAVKHFSCHKDFKTTRFRFECNHVLDRIRTSLAEPGRALCLYYIARSHRHANLMSAASCTDEVLLMAGIDQEEKDYLFERAVWDSNLGLIKLFVDYGADVHSIDFEDACRTGNPEIAVDDQNISTGHKLYRGTATGPSDRQAFANQFRWRKNTAIAHIQKVLLDNYHP